MRKSFFGILIFFSVLLFACSLDPLVSSENELKEFALEGQVGNAKINDNEIIVNLSGQAYLSDLSSLAATKIVVSDYATVSPKVGEKQDFTKPVEYIVTAEDGTINIYTVIVLSHDFDPKQIPNSSFDAWHTGHHGSFTYPEIGANSYDLTWGTGNKGAGFIINIDSKINFPSVQEIIVEEDRLVAKLETQNLGSLAAGTLGGGKGVAAGSIFTGTFVMANLVNAHPILGFPFTEQPSSFRIEYKYFPAAQMYNGKLEKLKGSDALDMYVVLERREGKTIKRLGLGWYRSFEIQEEWKTIEVEIKYAKGVAPDGVEDYQRKVMKYGIDGDIKITDPSLLAEATWGDITIEKPTHIIAVFTSSYMGDYFIGAPGSTLYIDNFELLYKQSSVNNNQ